MTSLMKRFETRDGERGAILPIVALTIIILLVFAAFTVDLGAAWAERRQDQTAADAAAMAAGLEYLRDGGAPSSAETIDMVIDYVDRNLPNGPTRADWQACVDNDKPDALYVALTDDADPQNTYDCISLRQEAGAPSLLRVRVPDRNVPTAFARVIGIDSIPVNAAAIVELSYNAAAKVLPFSLQLNPANEECLGVPPNGQNPGDVAPCNDGSDSGNFGLLDSPWFGTGSQPPHATGDTCQDGQGSYNARTELNLALGLDHIVKEWPYGNSPPWIPNQEYKPPNGAPQGVGYDNCTAAAADEEPFIMKTETGTETGNSAVFSDGMVGPGPYGTVAAPGKIRQTGGLNGGPTGSHPVYEFPDTISLKGANIDNVGLWQYLVDPATGGPVTGGSYSNDCDFDFTDPDFVGRARTTQMIDCIKPGGDSPKFGEALLDSPRYAVVPVLNYHGGSQTGLGWYAITEMRPVYIQSTWYDCTNSKSTCLFHPDDFGDDPAVPEYYSTYLNPGEGEEAACYKKKETDKTCKTPALIKLKGASAIVLDWSMLPPGSENAVGDTQPYLVQLYR